MTDTALIEPSNEAPAAQEPVSVSRLGVAVDDMHYLIDLSEAGEIMPMPETVARVPGARGWFRGLANLRGSLYGVVDLGEFRSGTPTRFGKDTRLLAFSSRLDVNAAMLVTRMTGLQSMDGLARAEHDPDAPAWLGAAWTDASGVRWHELSLEALCRDEKFLAIAR